MRSGFLRLLTDLQVGRSHKAAPGSEFVLIDGHPVRIVLRPRSTRIGLKIDAVRREAVVSMPRPGDHRRAVDFARQNAEWIVSRLSALPRVHAPHPGETVTIFGAPLQLVGRPGRPARILGSDGQLTGFGAPADAAFGDRIIGLIKREARTYFTDRTMYYADLLGQNLPAVSIVDAKGRWGSCKQPYQGKPAWIRYSWRLSLAPESVADYVAAHECAHLIEANHGPGFWKLVRQISGDPAPHRRWLRAHGSGLKAFVPSIPERNPSSVN